MSTAEKFIVLPFKRVRGGIAPGEMRQASTAASAEKIATAMSGRHLGVAAYSVQVDMESGDMSSPRILIQFGEIADIAA
jgi:hypothetical protein